MNRTLYTALSWRILLSLLLLLALAGCARQSQLPPADDVQVTMTVEPDPPAVGPATLFVSLTDAEGNPVEDALLKVKGDMSHAGMEPVIAEAEGGRGGVYELPITWTMGGDWFVTIDVTLTDGRTLSRRFDLSVSGDMGMDMGE